MAACCTIPQRIWRQPHGKISTQPGIAEIQFRGLAETFQLIVGIRCEQINDMKSYQHFQPFLRRARRNISGFCQRCVIDLFRHKGSTANKEFTETHRIRNSTSLSYIPHQVSVDVGVEILLTKLIVHALYLGHTALPNVVEYLNHIVFRKFTLSCL